MGSSSVGIGKRRSSSVGIGNLPVTVEAEQLRELAEKAVGVTGCVYACDVMRDNPIPNGAATGRVQFENADYAMELCNICRIGNLEHEGCPLYVYMLPSDFADRPELQTYFGACLHAGCLLNSTSLSLLWTASHVVVKFWFRRHYRVEFLVSQDGEDYKIELGFGDISRTHSCIANDKHCALFMFRSAAKLYQKVSSEEPNSGYINNYLKYCKGETNVKWARTTDFSKNSAIGQASLFCLEFANGWELPKFVAEMPFYQTMPVELGMKNSSFHPTVPSVFNVRIPPGVILPYDVIFQVNSLVHHGILSAPALTYEFFQILQTYNGSPFHVNIALSEMSRLKSPCLEPHNRLKRRLCELGCGDLQASKRFKSRLYNLYNADFKQSDRAAVFKQKKMMKFYKAVVTPSKIYHIGPELKRSNRVTRHFSKNIEDFVKVTFVDEDYEKLHFSELTVKTEKGSSGALKGSKIHDRILTTLKDGLVIHNKKFDFLAFSASQLRENSVWMFASTKEVTSSHIRNWMGNFENIKNVALYSARLGQSFSCSWETFVVEKNECRTIEDIEVITDGVKYCFSDGIGKISPRFAKRICSKCELDCKTPPSAFQIRYAGYKGVVAVDPTMTRLRRFKLSLRPSMLKFDSNYRILDVLSYSKSLPCYLNREIITLLSTLGVPDENFESLQRDALLHLELMLTDREKAIDFLSLMSSGDNNMLIEMLSSGYCPSSEQYLLMMLQAFKDCYLLKHKTKSRIFVPKGRVLMGCLDETASLNYGEVFIRVTKIKTKLNYDGLNLVEDSDTCVLKGKVIVTKNPCLHPGDIRVLEAVNIPELKHMIDCVVFPQKGHRPHPNECSGSDLDGDLYFISWDERLIPPFQDAAMDCIDRPPSKLNHSVTIEEVQEYFVNYMLNDTLGLISNAHSVHADKEPLKARSPKCLELAKLQGKAVDFAKTGVPAEMPYSLFPKEYPDFMEKNDRPMYISTGILGKLYRAAKDRLSENKKAVIGRHCGIKYDKSLECDGFQAFLNDAMICKMQYDTKLRELMEFYGIQNEAEMIIGSIMKSSKDFIREKKKYGGMKQEIQEKIRDLRNDAHNWFINCCKVHRKDSAFASAWYHVTYHPNYWSEGSLLSFPWIKYKLLLNIKRFNETKACQQREAP